MSLIRKYQYEPIGNETPRFNRGFPLAVVIILGVVVLIIVGLSQSFGKTTDYANARMVYLAAGYTAMNSMATGNYQVPVQKDLLELIGEEINAEAIISVVDENQDASIDYIIYTKNGLATKYSPGNMDVTSEK